MDNKRHKWRICGSGEHWVNPHRRKRSRKSNSTRPLINVKGYCRASKTEKNYLGVEEMRYMANTYFTDLLKLRSARTLGFNHGDQFDRLIVGWVKYWNEEFDPKVPLNPNLVKVLIATESSFMPSSKAMAGKNNLALGLMQITEETIRILQKERGGELKDFYIVVGKSSIEDPAVNICAGVRWLFRKQQLASVRLKREATWFEAAMEYKAYLSKYVKKDPDAIAKVRKLEKTFKQFLN